ncbi:E1 ubiquitin-activating protein aos1 [Coemansia nantahalensis]|uniref:E1 ubiquitin-activating protein aos1 n=1 Tax=Coemansia helicoidea TaxID=1286919 RepID=A0ACC1L2R5_9FUNG|nr:E1 ubiquitin-activating protein aos1 [Coemansia nantahalensis]KAJ2799677.1 E1 ubiquitin-activating protein aos1 [Coemansia helicoidea]
MQVAGADAPAGEEISKAEVALYDRQIRLWGLEAQGRLRRSAVCFDGVKAVTLEACKNLVLAGIGHITIHDSRPVAAADLEVQYYFQDGDMGRPKDQVLAERLRLLNPRVDVQAQGMDRAFDVVVAVGKTGSAAQAVAERCRQRGEKFVAADSFGLFGYLFADCLDKHEYLEGAKEGAPPQKATAAYRPLAQSLAARPDVANVQRLQRKYPPLVFVCQALVAGDSVEDEMTAAALEAAVAKTLQERDIPRGIVDGDLVGRVAQSWGAEIVACAAVVGGTLAQEVLKIVTQKDMPVNNWHVYDALRGDGITCTL